MSLPAVSKHLKVLERAGLIAREIDGRLHRCTLNSAGFRGAAAWIDQHQRFWDQHIDALERHVTRPDTRRARAPHKESKKS